MRHEELKFVPSRELGDGYRWRLRSATGETLAASGAGQPSPARAFARPTCAPSWQIITLTWRSSTRQPWASGLSAFLLSYSPKRIEEEELSRVRPKT